MMIVPLSIYCILCLQLCNLVQGHGRLMDPPARNSMWRFGFPNPVNYNDNELFCGGYAGKCQKYHFLCKFIIYDHNIQINFF